MTTKMAFTIRSGNGKTGPIPTTEYSRDTCPASCPFFDRAAGRARCYGGDHWANIHWSRLTDGTRDRDLDSRGTVGDISTTTEAMHKRADKQRSRPRYGRDAVVGDRPHDGTGRILWGPLRAIKSAWLALVDRPFSYTHHDLSVPENRAIIRECIDDGFTINASANTLDHADRLAADGWPTVVVLPEDASGRILTPEGRRVAICPATRKGSEVTCATCGLCANASTDRPIIGFPLHGSGRANAARMIAEWMSETEV